MAKSPKEKSGIELHPDAWERFERAARVVAKTPPQHRKAKKMKRVRNQIAFKKPRQSQN
jgi:hypothetical protein